MITLNDITKMSRGEKAFVNIASYLGVFPRTVFEQVNIENNSITYCIRAYFRNEKNGKSYSHPFYFYREDEAEEAKKLLELITSNYHSVYITGDNLI